MALPLRPRPSAPACAPCATTWDASAAPDGATARIGLKRARCKDAKNNFFTPWEVTVEIGGKTLQGCGRGALPKAPKAAPAAAGATDEAGGDEAGAE